MKPYMVYQLPTGVDRSGLCKHPQHNDLIWVPSTPKPHSNEALLIDLYEETSWASVASEDIDGRTSSFCPEVRCSESYVALPRCYGWLRAENWARRRREDRWSTKAKGTEETKDQRRAKKAEKGEKKGSRKLKKTGEATRAMFPFLVFGSLKARQTWGTNSQTGPKKRQRHDVPSWSLVPL